MEDILCRIIAKPIRKHHIVFDRTSTFKELGADSLDVVQILVSIEEAFDIDLVDEDLKDIVNIGELMDYIKKKVDEKKYR
jgi:acyl carrier protein